MNDGDPTQYARLKLHLAEAHAIADGANVTVAVIDSGIDLKHPEFAGVMITPFDVLDSREGPHAHGTGVAGLIGAVRGNGYGIDGVADNVRIMSIKAVPNGDEYDKDVANAIRYAVDNGAMVINMSFGKAYSAHPKEVYEAMKYAESKGVLLIHAAGNDGENIDEKPNFPAVKYAFQTEDFKNVLTIGASTRVKKGKLAASFSNYGNPPVDYAEPGVSIKSTWKDGGYNTISGTSMATPHLAGLLLAGSIRSVGTVSDDPDGNADTIGVH